MSRAPGFVLELRFLQRRVFSDAETRSRGFRSLAGVPDSERSDREQKGSRGAEIFTKIRAWEQKTVRSTVAAKI